MDSPPFLIITIKKCKVNRDVLFLHLPTCQSMTHPVGGLPKSLLSLLPRPQTHRDVFTLSRGPMCSMKAVPVPRLGINLRSIYAVEIEG